MEHLFISVCLNAASLSHKKNEAVFGALFVDLPNLFQFSLMIEQISL